MGMFDDVEIDRKFNQVPGEYRCSFQSKDLDCDGSQYRIDAAGLFLKVDYPIGKPEKLYHSKSLNQDIELHAFSKELVVRVRMGEVVSVILNSRNSEYWDGIEPTWEEFIER